MDPAWTSIVQSIAVDFQRSIAIFSLCIVRFTAAFIVLPFTGRTVMPMLARAGLAMSLAILVFPLVFAVYPEDGLAPDLLGKILIKEIFIGLTIGYLVSIVFWIAESIGHFVDTHRGATLAGAMFQTFGEDSSPLGGFLLQLTIILFFLGGGLRLFLEGFYQSYVVWPVLSYFPNIDSTIVDFIIDQFAFMLFVAVVFSAPMVIAMFLVEFCLALMNRFVPQLQVFFLALPLKSAIAIFILYFYLEYLLDFLKSNVVEKLSAQFDELIKLF